VVHCYVKLSSYWAKSIRNDNPHAAETGKQQTGLSSHVQETILQFQQPHTNEMTACYDFYNAQG
jgi:hypothetical protein